MRIIDNPVEQKTEDIEQIQLVTDMPDDPELAIKKTFLKFEIGFLSKDIDTIAECLSPAFEWCPPSGEFFTGKEAALAEMERRFGLPNGPEFSKSRIKIHDNTVIQTYRVSIKTPEGMQKKLRGLDVYKFREGLLLRKDAYWKLPG